MKQKPGLCEAKLFVERVPKVNRWPACLHVGTVATVFAQCKAGPECKAYLANRNAKGCPKEPPIHTANRPFQNLQSNIVFTAA